MTKTVECPKCGNEMEETELNFWCKKCQGFYYELKQQMAATPKN